MKWMNAAPEIYYLAAALWFLFFSFVSRPDPKREQAIASSWPPWG